MSAKHEVLFVAYAVKSEFSTFCALYSILRRQIDFLKFVQVVPPCQFEIHACKSYRRASQYICLENGKSLLDVVKECRKSSVKTLEETIQNIIGPMPVKESVICRNCSGGQYDFLVLFYYLLIFLYT